MGEDKIRSNITGVKLKLYFDNLEDKKEMDNYFEEYSKVATFAAKKLNQIRNSFTDLWMLDSNGRKLRGDDKKPIRPKGLCSVCKEEKELIKENKISKEKLCLSCYSTEYSNLMIRKKLISRTKPRKNKQGIIEPPRKVDSKLNIHNAGNLSDTTYHLATRDAINTLKALKEQRREKTNRLKRDKDHLKKFEEIINFEDKRFELLRKERQRTSRFVHIEDKDKNLRGWTINGINSKIRILRRNTERVEHSLSRPTPIRFKGSKISLHNSIVFDLDKNKVRIPLWKSKWYTFSGTNVKNRHGIEFFTQKLSKIRPKKYGFLIRRSIKKNPISLDNYEFYLQYPIEENVPLKKVSNIMGIDIGLNKLLTTAIFNPKKDKPIFVRIIKDEAFYMRIKRRKQLYYLRGKKNKRQKIKRMRSIESKINQSYHKKTKDIINWATKNNAAIVLENLKDMRKKSRIRERKEVKYKLSQFVYKTIRSMIEYKARMYGIPVILVEPEGTSYTCSKCGSTNTSRPKQAIFVCNNSECILNRDGKQRQINADYNAACNIAKKGLKTEEWKDIVLNA